MVVLEEGKNDIGFSNIHGWKPANVFRSFVRMQRKSGKAD